MLEKLLGIKYPYLLKNAYVYTDKSSSISIGKNVTLKDCKIHLTNGSKLVIEDNVRIENVLIASSRSTIQIGAYSYLSNGNMPYRNRIVATGSTITLGHHNRLRTEKIWVRFGGHLKTGNYININEYSEIRCDESIEIKDYVEISYKVKIWDTNTHEFEDLQTRRERWEREYLKRDVSEKPITKPVRIGNDVWIGESATILKGTEIGSGCIIGFGTIVSNKAIPDNMTVLNKIENRIIPNK